MDMVTPKYSQTEYGVLIVRYEDSIPSCAVAFRVPNQTSSLDELECIDESETNVTLQLIGQLEKNVDTLEKIQIDELLMNKYYSLIPSEEYNIREKFMSLYKSWKNDTALLSSITEKCIHPSYQQIIGVGSNVLPYIFEMLSDRFDHWFWALKAITGADPVDQADKGNIKKMREAWLNWWHTR